ncbi:Lsr2 family protein [Saccharopolyspora cebuensis]|uniref:Lsr2 family protein n=1 Tax=Saccharopolyspora cebuensis TaxID=418759 RepID=A0ABV4CMV6_9PSEU
MAERIQVELVDDIDGSPAQHTITFALDGVTYEIDLNDEHAQRLRSVLERYIARARTPEQAARGGKQQEREEREARQVNKQLTEQIRGAAQRTRDHLKEKAREESPDDSAAEIDAAHEEPARDEPAPEPQPEETGEPPKSPAVSLPQFSSAVD